MECDKCATREKEFRQAYQAATYDESNICGWFWADAEAPELGWLGSFESRDAAIENAKQIGPEYFKSEDDLALIEVGRIPQKRIGELECELTALKARQCAGCRYWEAHAPPIQDMGTCELHPAATLPAHANCQGWEAIEAGEGE